MNKIDIFNTSVVINDYRLGDCEQLENYFKVYDPITHGYYYLGLYYDSENKKLYLPRGIDIWLVEKLIGTDAHVNMNCHYKYKKNDDIYIKYLPRDDVQKETLRFMLGKEEYRRTATETQLSVNLNTGKGKTYVTIGTLAYTGIRGIVITNSVSWLEQWKQRTIEYTNITNKEIYIISGSLQVKKFLRATDEELDKYKLFLITHDTIQSYASNNGWESIGVLFEKLKIGVKIYDEAHLNFSNMCMIDFYTNVYKTYYLTATPAKSSERENQIFQLYFKNIPAIDLFDSENDPHTKYIAISYNSRPSPVLVSKCKNKYGLDRNKYANSVVYQDNFIKLLVVLMDIGLRMTMAPNKKFLIYSMTNESIKVIYDTILDYFPDLQNDIGIFTSVTPKEDKSIALSKRVILSTTKSAGAAVDIPGLKLTIILAEPFKSEVISRQVLGRTRDKNTLCIDVIDKGFYQCVNYYYKKLPIFKKYALECSNIQLKDQDLDERFNTILDKLNQRYYIPEQLMTKLEPLMTKI